MGTVLTIMLGIVIGKVIGIALDGALDPASRQEFTETYILPFRGIEKHAA